MNTSSGLLYDELPYTPLPAEHNHSLNVGLKQNFQAEAIIDGHEFTSNNRSGRIKVNIAAFTDRTHHDLDTAAVAIYYDPDEAISDDNILNQLALTGAPFVLIGRRDHVSPVGIKVNGRIEPVRLANNYPYSQIGEFFERHKTDISPERISAVKNGRAIFDAFSQLNSFQLRLFAFEAITKDKLARLFGESVSVLKSRIRDENLAVDYAVQLLGAVILAHKGRLGAEFTKPASSVDDLLAAAAENFPSYFQGNIEKSHIPHLRDAYSLLQQVTYSSFTPDMLSELYVRAYPSKELRKREGRYDTPLYLTRMVLNNLPVETIRPEERFLLDMTCGWGSFLVAGYERFNRMSDMQDVNLSHHIFGNDLDRFTAQLARVALLVTSLSDTWKVDNRDALKLTIGEYQPTIIVGNPPFKGARDKGSQATEIDYSTGRSKRFQEADNFLLKAIQLLQPGGYLGMLMPQSFAIGEASSHVRKALLETCDSLDFWDLPLDVFRGQARTSPMVIFAQKRFQAGSPLNFPVRIRSAQKHFLESQGAFSASNVAVSQADWGQASVKARSKSASVTHLITYTTILSQLEWGEIRERCKTVEDIAEIVPGAIVGTKRRWADYPNPKRVPWLSNSKDAIPRTFFIRYGKETVLYPNELEEPRKSKNPKKDKEHLLLSPKVLMATLANPSWGQRSKVAIDREGYCVADGFYAFIPKPPTISIEVLAALLSWDVSNAWIVESLRYPRIQRRVLSTIPVPVLTPNDCNLIQDAIHRIEEAAANESTNLEAQQVLDEVFRRAYGLNDRVFQRIRLVREWDTRAKQIDQPFFEPLKETLPVQGIVENVDGLHQTITLWFTGIQEQVTLPIDDNMPGWMLRQGAAFKADVTYRALLDGDWPKLRWWNVRPQELTYLSEEELIESITDELG